MRQQGLMRWLLVDVLALVMVMGLVVDARGGEVFLASALQVDTEEGTVTLPLFEGRSSDGDSVWYIITEASDEAAAEKLGLSWSPKLANALGTPAVQTVAFDGDLFTFSGVVDFAPQRLVVPDPTNGFPPLTAIPGSSGDAVYTPLITTGDGIVLNAPQVANSSGMHDRVVHIDFDGLTVTLELTEGRYHGKTIFYISTEATAPDVAAIETATFAPNLNAAPGLASNGDDSARSSIIPVVNGERGMDNRERQGLQSALLGEGSPLNITIIHPRNRGRQPTYSPLWDVHPAVWTEAAIAAGERERLEHHAKVAKAVRDGLIVSGGMGPMNPDLGGLRAAGVIVNCPLISMD